MPLTYAEALEFIFPRTTTIKFGLETTRALLGALGDPHELVPVVHVGGTNGKGKRERVKRESQNNNKDSCSNAGLQPVE